MTDCDRFRGRAQGAPTIHPLVCSPVDKVFCLCSSVCVCAVANSKSVFKANHRDNTDSTTDVAVLTMSQRILREPDNSEILVCPCLHFQGNYKENEKVGQASPQFSIVIAI
jgi:hypothetical protein